MLHPQLVPNNLAFWGHIKHTPKLYLQSFNLCLEYFKDRGHNVLNNSDLAITRLEHILFQKIKVEIRLYVTYQQVTAILDRVKVARTAVFVCLNPGGEHRDTP